MSGTRAPRSLRAASMARREWCEFTITSCSVSGDGRETTDMSVEGATRAELRQLDRNGVVDEERRAQPRALQPFELVRLVEPGMRAVEEYRRLAARSRHPTLEASFRRARCRATEKKSASRKRERQRFAVRMRTGRVALRSIGECEPGAQRQIVRVRLRPSHRAARRARPATRCRARAPAVGRRRNPAHEYANGALILEQVLGVGVFDPVDAGWTATNYPRRKPGYIEENLHPANRRWPPPRLKPREALRQRLAEPSGRGPAPARPLPAM